MGRANPTSQPTDVRIRWTTRSAVLGPVNTGGRRSRPGCGLTAARFSSRPDHVYGSSSLACTCNEPRCLLMVHHEAGGPPRSSFFLSPSFPRSTVCAILSFFLPSSSSHVPTSAATPGPHHRTRPLATHAAGTKEGVGEPVQGCCGSPFLPAFLLPRGWAARGRGGKRALQSSPLPKWNTRHDLHSTCSRLRNTHGQSLKGEKSNTSTVCSSCPAPRACGTGRH